MAKVIKETKVYFDGVSSRILAGTVYPDDAPIVLANPDLFIFEDKEEVKVEVELPEVKVETEEVLLVEEPVAAVEVEVVEETVVEETPAEEVAEEKPAKKRRKRK